MAPADADEYFGRVLRPAAKGTQLERAQALRRISCSCQAGGCRAGALEGKAIMKWNLPKAGVAFVRGGSVRLAGDPGCSR